MVAVLTFLLSSIPAGKPDAFMDCACLPPPYPGLVAK